MRKLIKYISEHAYTHIYHIIADISAKWDVKYTVFGLNKWLHQQGFTYKKSKGVPHKFDSEKQAEFVEHYEILQTLFSEISVFLSWRLLTQRRQQKSPKVGLEKGFIRSSIR